MLKSVRCVLGLEDSKKWKQEEEIEF